MHFVYGNKCFLLNASLLLLFLFLWIQTRVQMYKSFIFLIVVFPLCLYCENRSVNKRFAKAEILMNDAPEEALSILQSVPLSALKSEGQYAHYALLTSWALDKNYIDVYSDTLAIVAANYYEKTQDHRSRMLAFYYEGVVLLNSANYTTAAIYMEKAAKEASFLNDYLYLGLSNRALAQIMNETNNFSQAILYEEAALASFQAGDLKNHELYEWLSLAIDCSNDRRFSRAISISDSLLSVTDSPSLQGCFQLVIAGALVESGNDNYGTATDIYGRIDKNLFELTDLGYYALALDKVGERDSSDVYMKYAFTKARNHIDSAAVSVFLARIESNRGHHQKAYQLFTNAVNVQDSLTRVLLGQSVSVAVKDYYNKEAEYQEVAAQNAKKTTLLTILLFALLSIIVLFIVIIRKKDSDTLLKEQLANLALEKYKNSRLFADNAHLLGSLISARLGHLDRLADDYMAAATPEEKDKIFKDYKHRCASIMKDTEVYNSLEADLNEYCDGIMKMLRAEVPALKENHIRTITLLFAGIPPISVQILTGKPSRKAVDMERSRYRKVIRESGAEHTSLFLEMLETKPRHPKQ